MRTDKDIYFHDMALRCAKQGTCIRRNYGAILVDNYGAIISTGYTGQPIGQTHCTDINKCWRKDNNIPSGQCYEKCKSVHAEMNCIIQAGKQARNTTMYLAGINMETLNEIYNPQPCFLCIKLILNANIKEIICKSDNLNENFIINYNPIDIYQRLSNEIFK
jgi:dCMP deaminase